MKKPTSELPLNLGSATDATTRFKAKPIDLVFNFIDGSDLPNFVRYTLV